MRLTPRDSAFYEMFTEAGRNVAAAADLLGGLVDPTPTGHESPSRCGARTRRRHRHASDPAPAQHQLRHPVRSRGHLPAGERPGDVVDSMEAAADFVVLTGIGKLPLLMEDQIALLRRSAARRPKPCRG